MARENKTPLPLPQEGFARLPQVLHVLGISASAWWQGVKDGKYPQPVKLGPRTTVWRVEEIRELIRLASKPSVLSQKFMLKITHFNEGSYYAKGPSPRGYNFK